MITDDLHNFHPGFIGHNMVIYDTRGYNTKMVNIYKEIYTIF